MKITFEDEYMPEDIDGIVRSEIIRIVNEKISADLPKRIEAAFDKSIQKKIDEFVKAKFKTPTWEVQPTKTNAMPARVTLEDKLNIAFNNYFNQSVDSRTGAPSDHWSSQRMNRIDYLIRQYAEPLYKEMMKKPIEESVAQLKLDLKRISSEKIKEEVKILFQRLFTGQMFS